VVWLEKLKEYNVSDEDFEKFCKQYGEFATNRELMAKLYLVREKGVKVAEMPITGPITKVSELKVNTTSVIKVIIIQCVDTRQYVGCPRCYRAIQAAPNTDVVCERDGAVRAETLSWSNFLAGDDTGEIMLTFPPRIPQVPKVGDVIVAQGSLSEQYEFYVNRYNVVVAAPPTQAAATTPAPAVQPTAPTAAVEQTVLKCPICGLQQKNETGLKLHIKMGHKVNPEDVLKKPAGVQPITKPSETPKPTEEAEPVEKPVGETKPAIPDEAVKYTRVASIINKPFEEFKAWIVNKFPTINIDELLKAAGAKVEDGKLKKVS
jgi:uncharacterized C2H2 Zn-finger protein